MRMTAKLLLTAAAFAVAPAASAATFTPGDPNFTVVGNPFTGPVSGFYGNGGLSGSFTDLFTFTIGANGIGSGSIATSGTGSTATNLSSVIFNNGTTNYAVAIMNGLGSLEGIPISAGTLNTLTIMGTGAGNGSYGGNLTFTPSAIPEPATWAMLMFGFGALGMVVRRRRQKTSVAYAF